MSKLEKRHKLALQMLDPSVGRVNKILHPDLKKKLDEIDEMCAQAGGQLVSRQAVAHIISDFREHHPATPLLLDKE